MSVWGDVSPEHRESFVRDAFGPSPSAPLNLQHDPGMLIREAADYELRNGPDSLDVEAVLPANSAALALVRRGALRGFSVEFESSQEYRDDTGTRIIQQAALVGVALVDEPSYPASVAEVRRRGDRGGRLFTARGRVPTGKRVDCRCSPGDCTEALFEDGAFDNVTRDQARDVLAVVGDYANAIASRNRGGVRFWNGRDGSLEFAIDVPNTERGRALRETMDSVDVYARPVLDVDASDVSIVDKLATYREARLRALTVGPTDANRGWTALVVGRDGEGPEADATPPAARRVRRWL